MTETSSTG